jgi:hypothetical protein
LPLLSRGHVGATLWSHENCKNKGGEMATLKKTLIISFLVMMTMWILIVITKNIVNNPIIKFILFGVIFFIPLINFTWKKFQTRDMMFVMQKIMAFITFGLFLLRAYVDNKIGIVVDVLTGIFVALWIVVSIKMILVWNLKD